MAEHPFVYPLSRRRLIRVGALGAAAAFVRPSWAKDGAKAATAVAPAPGETESHGLSTFGDLAEPEDFKFFGYVNPNAPKGGTLALSPASPTFDTFNAYVLRGNPATGMSLVFDTLMNQSLDERDAYYGLVAKKVRISPDKLTYTFLLRKEARFHDGSPLTAHDAAFSLNILKSKGHPVISQMLRDLESATAEADDVLVVKFAPGRTRDLPLNVVSQPIFSRAYYKDRDFETTTLEPPLGSGPYKVGQFEQGRYVAFQRVPDYWAKDLPIAKGQGNFDVVRFEYFGDSQVAFEAFKAGAFTEREENIARVWSTGYDFPAFKDGRVKRATMPNNNIPNIQGWMFNTRKKIFRDPRVREAIGYAFDYEWTSRNLMYDAYKRISSYFENSELAARGLPSEAEKALLEPWRDQLPAEVFGEPFTSPVSDGSGQDRAMLKKANDLFIAAGCTRKDGVLRLPDGTPLEFEFLDNSNVFERHTQPFIKNLKLLGVTARIRIVDAAQYKKRLEDFDFDVVHDVMMMAWNPGEELRAYFSSQTANVNGSRNLAGISHPAVDALVDKALQANSREELVTCCRALDRALRSQRYWVPHWYNPVHRYAYWDLFGQPERPPKFDTGVLWTWWWDEEKARKINFTGR
ncbi:MAG: ABC transporter substrate-binding protein [Hyphomicrobiales bacterium]|nr:MAG: ABC transporter substrate-binding protein [Hyphomicrobiales bacterium]